MKHPGIIIWAAFFTVFCAACELHPAGEFTLSGWSPPPSPNRFARSVHPLLVAACAAAACHGRETTFTLHQAPSWSGPEVETAAQLPEPFRQDYFLVLAFSNPSDEAASEFLIWGSGQVESHPGGAALNKQQAGEVLDWLEGQP
jgi:hypothetical protein